MARKAPELDTPFRKGERVLATRDLEDVGKGTRGKIQLANGLGSWRRYWVHFDSSRVMGQVSHHDLARPDQLDAWIKREEERQQAALRVEEEAPEPVASTNGDGGGAGTSGVAAKIPPALLERSRAAKKRLLG
jgi:hypothetical protein